MKTFTPLHNYILIKRNEAVKMTPGGLVIPSSATEKSSDGLVVGVGPGIFSNGVLVATSVVKDQQIMLEKHAGIDIKIDDQEFVLVKETNIMGIITL